MTAYRTERFTFKSGINSSSDFKSAYAMVSNYISSTVGKFFSEEAFIEGQIMTYDYMSANEIRNLISDILKKRGIINIVISNAGELCDIIRQFPLGVNHRME